MCSPLAKGRIYSEDTAERQALIGPLNSNTDKTVHTAWSAHNFVLALGVPLHQASSHPPGIDRGTLRSIHFGSVTRFNLQHCPIDSVAIRPAGADPRRFPQKNVSRCGDDLE
jgi:hypothetical protein